MSNYVYPCRINEKADPSHDIVERAGQNLWGYRPAPANAVLPPQEGS
jgi:hypothetical protein